MKSKKAEFSEEFKEHSRKRNKDWYKEKVVRDEIECQFGLMIRDKNDHDNYVMLNFSDLEDIVKYFDAFKRIFRE